MKKILISYKKEIDRYLKKNKHKQVPQQIMELVEISKKHDLKLSKKKNKK